jgi:hypothetical protein
MPGGISGETVRGNAEAGLSGEWEGGEEEKNEVARHGKLLGSSHYSFE